MTGPRIASTFAGLLLVAVAAAGGLPQTRTRGPEREAPAFPWVLIPQDAILGHLVEGNFKEPRGVFFEPEAEELFVADSKNGLVGIFDPEGTPLFTFGGSPPLGDIRQVVVRSDGTILVVRGEANEIAVFSYRGDPRPSLVFPAPEAPPGELVPVRIAAYCQGRDGRHVVASNDPPRILVFDEDLSLVRTIEPEKGGAQFQVITGMAVSVDGLMAVVDFKATPVQIFDAGGKFVRGFGGRDIAREDFSAPMALEFDDLGFLHVVDTLRHEVKIFDVSGQYLAQYGGRFSDRGGGRAPGEMLFPTSVACGKEGTVYVSERFGHRVQIFKRVPADPYGKPRLRIPPVSGTERR